MSESFENTVLQVKALLKDIDLQTDLFCQNTGLACKSGCGACCENPQVETTVTEVLPLAQALYLKVNKDEIYGAIVKAIGQRCYFYEPDKNVPGQGRCGVYEFRPGLCRLFAFSAKQDKFNQSHLVTCRIIKEEKPQAVALAKAHLSRGLPAPIINQHTHKVMAIDAHHGQKLLPINLAIKKALDIVSLQYPG